MQAYWTEFARSGDPARGGTNELPAWTAWDEGGDKYLVLDATPHEGLRLRERECDFWEPFYFRSTTGTQPAWQP